MEKAILKTLAYTDIFDYPLKINEIHKWLMVKKATLRQVEKALGKLVQSAKCKVQSGYYFLPKRDEIVSKRKRREKQSKVYFKKAKAIAYFLKVIPWIKLVGVSGGLAMDNASTKDDIDLFLITSKDRIWLTRILVILILDLLGVRRKVDMKFSQVAGKLCANILLEEDQLEQNNKDIFTAHEVLQMKILWERGGIYQKYLMDNEWVFKFLPNWIGERIKNNELRIKHRKHNSLFLPLNSTLNIFEGLAKKFQLWYMKKPKGMERIEDGALYFHPNDIRLKVLEAYRQKVKNIISP